MTVTEVYNRMSEGKTNKVRFVTHKHFPKFHGDEVMATAILHTLFAPFHPFMELIETFDPKADGYTDNSVDTIIYDVGLGQYDHHQKAGEDSHCIREDGRKYSSAGLIWKEIGHIVMNGNQKDADMVYKRLISFIDDQDNGFEMNPLSFIISNMNVKNEKDQMRQFYLSVNAMESVLNTIIARCNEKNAESEAIKNIIENSNKKYVVSDKYYDGMLSALAEEGIPFYLYPNARDYKHKEYCFRTITPIDGEMNDHIKDIPNKVRNWEGVTFLHPSCFLGSAVTKERAIEIVEEILAE